MADTTTTDKSYSLQEITRGIGSDFKLDNPAIKDAFGKFEKGDKGLLQIKLQLPILAKTGKSIVDAGNNIKKIFDKSDVTDVVVDNDTLNIYFNDTSPDNKQVISFVQQQPSASGQQNIDYQTIAIPAIAWIVLQVISVLIVVGIIAAIIYWVIFKIIPQALSNAADKLGIPPTAVVPLLIGAGFVMTALFLSSNKNKKSRPQIVVVNEQSPYGGYIPMARPQGSYV